MNINPSRYFPTSTSFPLLFLRLSDALWKGWKKILKVLFWTENSFLFHCPRMYLIPISYMKNLFGIFWYSLCPDLLLYPLSTLCENSNVIGGYSEAPCIHGAQVQLLTSNIQVISHIERCGVFCCFGFLYIYIRSIHTRIKKCLTNIK